MTLLKTVVAGLALANVGYFLWTHGIGSATPVHRNDAAVGGASLRLATEGAAVSPSSAAAVHPDDAPPPVASLGLVPTAVTSPGVVAAATRCVSVGPFKDITEAAHAAATLRGGGYDPRQRGAEGEVWAGVWVFLPLPAIKAQADQVRAKLKAGGIDDALEMPGPNDTPVLSLGLYSEGKRAQGRVAQAQSLGLNPGLAERKRTGNVYWIDVDLKPSDASLNPADLQSDAAHNAHLEVKSCPAASSLR